MTWWITDTSIGQRLKFVRRFRRLTQKELGLLMGYSEKTADVRIAQYEKNARTPNSSTMVLPFTISRSISASVSMGTILTKRHTHRSEPVRNPNSRSRNTSLTISMLPRTFRSGVRWTSRNTVLLVMPCEPTMHFLTRREKPWVQ